MYLEMQGELARAVRDAIRTTFHIDPPPIGFQYPPKTTLGDLALTAPFELAKTLRRKPRDIAAELLPALEGLPGIRDIQVAGAGYLNLFLDRGVFAPRWIAALRGESTKATAQRRSHVIVEHTSINPNKAAHVGHVRNAVLGDSFVRILRHCGYAVGVQNYIDDTGVQVADVTVGFQHLEGKDIAAVRAISDRFDYYCWDLYARVAESYESAPENKKLQAEALHAIEAGDNATAELAAHISGRIVTCHLTTMARLGIRYDLLAHESDILRLHFWNRAFALMKESGAIRLEAEGKHAGCWVLGTTEGADEDKVIVRSNGIVTYTGKDIAYQLWKLGRLDRDFRYRRIATDGDGHELWTTTSEDGDADAPAFGHADAVYNVIDVGQSYPQRVVKAGVAALGHAGAAENSHHLGYEKVVLSKATASALGYSVSEDEAAVKVSGRRGLGVKADDLIDALVAKAKAEVDERGQDRDATERQRGAEAIATGALRYFMLRHGRTKVLTFDMDEALAFVGETGPYIQNGVVRARHILTKLEAAGHATSKLIARARGLPLATLLTGEEGEEIWALFVLMARSDELAEQAVRDEEVSVVAKHAFAVAQAFHSYYQKPQYSVLYADSEDLRAFRALVVDSFVRQMTVLTDLLGIPIPERM
jgi:arginyl-tRNA synthetase